jgi:adenylate kinase family enzyme
MTGRTGQRPASSGPPPARAVRILVYGVAGSGKTTLARRIGERTGLPWHQVDDLTWEPGWVAVPDEEQRQRIAAICAGERWVLDSAYGKWPFAAQDRAGGLLDSLDERCPALRQP